MTSILCITIIAYALGQIIKNEIDYRRTVKFCNELERIEQEYSQENLEAKSKEKDK